MMMEAVVQARYLSSTPMLDSWLSLYPAEGLLISVISSQTGPASSGKATIFAS